MIFANHIVHEDNHLLIVNKPAGVLVQGDKTGDMCLIDYAKLYVKQSKNKPGKVYMGLPHRIDRPVSGLVVLCKTSKSLIRMAKIFHDRAIEKTYLAVVHGTPDSIEGKLVDHLANNARGKKTFVSTAKDNDSKRAELAFNFLQKEASYSLLKITPKTGRKHQIRVQLSHAGWPIVGDLKYGSHVRLGHRICLHAVSLKFEHPVKNVEMYIISNPDREPEWEIFSSIYS